MTERMQKLLKAAEIMLPQDEHEADLDKLVASSMQTGYELGRLAAETDREATGHSS